MCGNLETKCLREPEESRDPAWVGQGGDREGNGRENWIDETLLAEAGLGTCNPESHISFLFVFGRPDWFSFFKQKCLPSSVQHRLVLKICVCLPEPTQTL